MEGSSTGVVHAENWNVVVTPVVEESLRHSDVDQRFFDDLLAYHELLHSWWESGATGPVERLLTTIMRAAGYLAEVRPYDGWLDGDPCGELDEHVQRLVRRLAEIEQQRVGSLPTEPSPERDAPSSGEYSSDGEGGTDDTYPSDRDAPSGSEYSSDGEGGTDSEFSSDDEYADQRARYDALRQILGFLELHSRGSADLIAKVDRYNTLYLGTAPRPTGWQWEVFDALEDVQRELVSVAESEGLPVAVVSRRCVGLDIVGLVDMVRSNMWRFSTPVDPAASATDEDTI